MFFNENVYRLDSNDRRYRFKVKDFIKEDFENKVILLAIKENEPQVVVRYADLHSSGTIFHASNKTNIV